MLAAGRTQCNERLQTGPLADRHLALQREGALGTHLQGNPARPPLADARRPHGDRPLAQPRLKQDLPDPAARRPHDRRFDRDRRRARAAPAGAAALPRRPRAAPARPRARGLLRRGAGAADPPARLARPDRRARDARRPRLALGAGTAGQGEEPDRRLRPRLHQRALRRQRRRRRGRREGEGDGGDGSARRRAAATTWSGTASASPT